jgi:cardiolipin synthase
LTLPNLITLLRILLVPLIFWLLASNELKLAFAVFLIAGVSDALDGYIAKQWQMTSQLGAYLDPLADKLLIVSVFAAMAYNGSLPLWLVTLVVSRDILIVAGVLLAWVLGHPMAIRPLLISKATTASQITLAALALANQAFELGQAHLVSMLIVVTAMLTFGSLVAYMRAWVHHMGASQVTRPDVAATRSAQSLPENEVQPAPWQK